MLLVAQMILPFTQLQRLNSRRRLTQLTGAAISNNVGPLEPITGVSNRWEAERFRLTLRGQCQNAGLPLFRHPIL
ncbi:MAG TPA: hypothetical protein DCK93_02315 [Blastocatellia bacterium]|nr:hypothetical protein [Blastocatellia bacterium]